MKGLQKMRTDDAKTEEEFLRKAPDWRKIILFNGPPRCGKSFGADRVMSFIRHNAPWTYPRLLDAAEPLKRAAHALYCAFHGWDYYDTKEGEAQKGLATGDFLGMSPREVYIALSEDFLKPKHGEEVVGFLLRKRIIREANSQIFVIPNAGFLPELDPLVKLVGQRNILLIEVHTADRTFEGDSRSYIGDAAKEKYPHIHLKKLPNVIGNDEDKAFYTMLCHGTAKTFLGIEEKEDA
jgi:hypothetical protein